MEEKSKLCFIVFLDDDNSIKEKVAMVKKEDGGVTIQIQDGKPFFIPYGRVLKIKERDEYDRH